MTGISVRINKDLYDSAVKEARAEYRTAPQQINFWAKIGRNALANPDLPVEAIRIYSLPKKKKVNPFPLKGKIPHDFKTKAHV